MKNQDNSYENISNFINNKNVELKDLSISCKHIGHNTDIMIDISSKRFACKIC